MFRLLCLFGLNVNAEKILPNPPENKGIQTPSMPLEGHTATLQVTCSFKGKLKVKPRERNSAPLRPLQHLHLLQNSLEDEGHGSRTHGESLCLSVSLSRTLCGGDLHHIRPQKCVCVVKKRFISRYK